MAVQPHTPLAVELFVAAVLVALSAPILGWGLFAAGVVIDFLARSVRLANSAEAPE